MSQRVSRAYVDRHVHGAGARSARLPNPYAPPEAEIHDPGAPAPESGIVQSVAVGLVLATAVWSPLLFEPLHNRLAWHAFQVAMAAGLAVLLARGVAWVRWAVVAACAAIAAEQLYTGLVVRQILQEVSVGTDSLRSVYWITFGVGGLHFTLAALLVLPRSVRSFYSSAQRAA